MKDARSAKHEAQELARSVRRDMSRHAVNTSEVEVSVSHGVITLHGKVRPLRGQEEGFESALKGMLTSLRQRPGIRDVYPEWTVTV